MTKPYDIRLTPQAVRQIQGLTPKQKKAIIKLIEALAINPRQTGAYKIDGMTGLYRESINQLYLIYKIEEHEVIILFVRN